MAVKYHHNRRPKSFLVRKVKDTLPEFYGGDFPNLIKFLENYYEFLDDSSGSSFGTNINELFSQRDVHAASTNSLNSIISEITGGLPNGDNFTDPNFYATRLAELARNKGTRFAAEEFFRAFFQIEAEISFPKDDIFVIGPGPWPGSPVDSSDASVSLIGPESQKFIQDYKLYQIYSILVKSGLSVNTWRELYKKFVHPAGWYFQGEVELVSQADAALNFTDLTADSIRPDVITGTIIEEATLLPLAPFTEMTTLFDSGARSYRASLIDVISKYQTLSASDINKFYHSVEQLITPNSFTFDDSNTRVSVATATPDFSLTLETMDNEMFTRYTSDSSF